MYLGAASGTTVSHVSDIVGPVSTFFFPKSVFFFLFITCIFILGVFMLTKMPTWLQVFLLLNQILKGWFNENK